ncbi:uncharacterized protein [Palaemon carinicauda]|uniref:uncharacterized protein n=1 Tax=Palaemon carinicauda TaxID=392227 RepID=UPI0035B571B1
MESNNNVVIMEALKSNLDCDSSILPTFSCSIQNRSIRALKDDGSQLNLISEELANALDLKVLQAEVELRINGINVSQKYASKLVEFEIIIGNAIHKIEALCIPSINIKLKLKGLGKVVYGFQTKGYVLVDEFLTPNSDCIENIDLILGTKSGYCLPLTEVVFGRNSRSMYAMTPFGVLLKGEIDTLLKDIPYLHQSSSVINCHQYVTGLRVKIDKPSSLDKCEVDYPIKVSEFSVIDEKGNVIRSGLDKATDDVLATICNKYIHLDNEVYDLENSELHDQLVKYCLDHTIQNEEGRLVMPLLWNAKVSHMLGRNFHLAKVILESNLKKLKRNPSHLQLMNEALKEQERVGIIERIPNLDQFVHEHPEHSFLPHMGVFKLNRETTKCRVVFLSNLCERNSTKGQTISHNQAIHAGPCLNQKLSSSLLHLRFDKLLVCFDLCKAFNQIALSDVDANRLCFLWYKNVEKGDFTIVAYRNVRLSFGLRCSPTLLMLGLYKILILDAGHDENQLKELKRCIYSLSYMDNCAFSANEIENLHWAYSVVGSIFSPYGFDLQQFVTNDRSLQGEIDSCTGSETGEVVKLLGMQWNRTLDCLLANKFQLNGKAKTKREILSTIASHFDLFGITGPILNRSRLFLHGLQCDRNLGWDDQLSPELRKEWHNIANQANSAPDIAIDRFVGRRDGKFYLAACCDSSKLLYGVVVYIIDIDSMSSSFVMAKNRMINRQLESKSIPSLEMQGVTFATEVVLDLYNELAGPLCINPLNVVGLHVFSDSQVALSWLNSSTNKLSKMQKRSVFVMNRIQHVENLCAKHPVHFAFVGGNENPADAITRCLSYRKLMQTNFYSGPECFKEKETFLCSENGNLSFIVPNPYAECKLDNSLEIEESVCTSSNVVAMSDNFEYFLKFEEFSSFDLLVSIYEKVILFVEKLKGRLKAKDSNKFAHLELKSNSIHERACKLVILQDQRAHFPEVFTYFSCSIQRKKDMPNIVGQLNVYVDNDGLLRVRSKCDKLIRRHGFPLLLAKNSHLTSLIVHNLHKKLNHTGCYSVLSEMRKRFYVPSYFSVVKRNLRECVFCRRFKSRTISINQSPYRKWRVSPPNVPFRYLFMDFIGPLSVKQQGKKGKIYLLCITCMWSRAVNLIICLDLSVKEFLRAFQIHCFQFGIPEYCISDLGSQLVSASNIIIDYIKDHETQSYFERNGVQSLKFDQFVKGHSQLGSMVEVCVKLVKRLIYGAIGKNVLEYHDFEFLIQQVIHLVNRRPIAFKEALRDQIGDDIPEPITPENLIHGYDLISVNIIPELHEGRDPDWIPENYSQSKFKQDYNQLQKVRNNLVKLYQEEFIANLIHQAVDVPDRYKPVTHNKISPGDIVLLKENFTKPNDYPMGVVKEIFTNTLGEVTGATILKGKTQELVKRHSSVIIPLLTRKDEIPNNSKVDVQESLVPKDTRVKRQAAIDSSERTRKILEA